MFICVPPPSVDPTPSIHGCPEDLVGFLQHSLPSPDIQLATGPQLQGLLRPHWNPKLQKCLGLGG